MKDLREEIEPKCVAGCISYYGGERRHYKSCPFYPDSFSKRYDDLLEELKDLKSIENKEG